MTITIMIMVTTTMAILRTTLKSLNRTWSLAPSLLVAAVGIVLFSGAFTPVRFVQEHVEVRAGGDVIEVEGVYEYRNAAPIPTLLRLGVPFPIDEYHPSPTAFALDEVNVEGRVIGAVEPVMHGDDVSVRLFFGPDQVRYLKLRYTQPTAVADGRYILTTTRDWGRPLKRASFGLVLAPGLEPVASSYDLARHADRGGYGCWAFERSEFWPDRDWIFSWAADMGE